MAEVYEYPHTGSPTATFTPSIDGFIDSSGEEYDEGILSEQSAGKQEYRYQEAIKVRTIRRGYRLNTDTDKTNFEAFKVAAGAKPIKFTDYLSVAHTVSFTSYVTRYTPLEGGYWAWDVELREEIP